jgi:peptide subunit release factor 1 (eRF1)
MRRDLDELLDRFGPRGDAFDSLGEDVARISRYVEDELDVQAKGVVLVACHRQGIFAPFPLDVPVETGFAVGSIPRLKPLVQVADAYPSHAVLVAEQRIAVLWLMAHRTWERAVELEASDYPRHQQQGGWSQRRYQARADERVEAFARTIAAEVRRELGEGSQGIPYLILAADEPMASAISGELHESVKSRLIGHIHLEVDADEAAITTATRPLIEAEERRREQEAVDAVRDGVGARARGVAGVEETSTALQTGQVMTLVINDDFSASGWADYTLPLYGAGEVPREHPAGGDKANLVPVELTDELLRLAIQEDAEIEMVRTAVPVSAEEQEEIPDAGDPIPRSPAARDLDGLGGVGAILRFALDIDQPTAEL